MSFANFSIFEYIERKKKATLVLFPGWATDYKIFKNLSLNFNYILPKVFSPFNCRESFLDFLEYKKIKKVSLFGYSLGGFFSADFASNYPELVDELILVSIREKYEVEKLNLIEVLLKKNKKAYLYKFYMQLFKRYENFLENRSLFKYYCDNLKLEVLIDGLEYFKKVKIEPQLLMKIKKIKIIHGEDDCIAPISEAISIKNKLKQAKFISFKDTGHLVFFEQNIEDKI